MTTHQPDPGAVAKRILIIYAVVILGSFMSNLNAAIANMALPTRGRALRRPLPAIQWVPTGYHRRFHPMGFE
jgi:hypothetical protein